LSIEIRADIREVLREGTPVVGLESTLISHGLPRPENLSVAREAERAVRAKASGLPDTFCASCPLLYERYSWCKAT
jgi:pseudouridine-5'-phosphate glycosidase